MLLSGGFFLIFGTAGASDQMKSHEFYIGSSDAAVTSAVAVPFSVYIGDNIGAVSQPVKSFFVEVSGIYTGGGSATVDLDSAAGTAQTFVLPNVGATPVPFEFIYRDESNYINPTSAGAYDYTFNFTPMGVTVYALGVKGRESHRYKPPICGGELAVYGDLISSVFESTGSADGPAYNSISWKGDFGGPGQNQGRVKFQIAASDSSAGPWTFIGGDTCGISDWFGPADPDAPVEIKCFPSLNNKRYWKYKMRICSDDCILSGSYTPTVTDVNLSWSP